MKKNVRAMFVAGLTVLMSAGCLVACGPKDAKETETMETSQSIYGTVSDDDLPRVAMLPSPEIVLTTIPEEDLTREVNQFTAAEPETTESEVETEVYEITTEAEEESETAETRGKSVAEERAEKEKSSAVSQESELKETTESEETEVQETTKAQ